MKLEKLIEVIGEFKEQYLSEESSDGEVEAETTPEAEKEEE